MKAQTSLVRCMAVAMSAAALFAGCVSVESTREKLNSGDSQKVKEAEDDICKIVKYGRLGVAEYVEYEQIEFLDLLAGRNDILVDICNYPGSMKIKGEAIRRIDFSKPGAGMMFLTNCFHGAINAAREADDRNLVWDVEKKAVDSLSEAELMRIIGKKLPGHDLALERMVSTTENVKILSYLLMHDLVRDDDMAGETMKRLLANSGKIKDRKTIEYLVHSSRMDWRLRKKLDDASLATIAKLAKQIPVDERVDMVMQEIRAVYYENYCDDGFTPLRMGVAIAAAGLDDAHVEMIVASVLERIAKLKADCRRSVSCEWDSKDEKVAKKLVKDLPKMSDDTVVNLLCRDGTTWRQIMGLVSAEIAYKALVSGNSKSEALEVELVKKLPRERLDMNVYNGVRFGLSRKAVNDNMPPEVKKEAAEALEKAFAAVQEKAKAAAKETFELEGFYLGMSFDDVKVVLTHHFPDYEVSETRDGTEKNADYIIHVPNQRSPFCYASANDKKVYQFNFGKKMLKKWYNYDVQTYIEWAFAYGRETKIDMKPQLIQKNTEVYEQDMSRSYTVWFNQESYQYKHNTKEYRLTYFGDEKDITLHGGLAGAIIKELAAKDFRYVRGDPGSLRVRVERD